MAQQYGAQAQDFYPGRVRCIADAVCIEKVTKRWKGELKSYCVEWHRLIAG